MGNIRDNIAYLYNEKLRGETVKVLILGASGMLGHKLYLHLSQYEELEVYATVRSRDLLLSYLSPDLQRNLHTNVDANNFDNLIRAIAATHPDVVINCIGIVKQGALGQDPLTCISINSLLSHKIAWACQAAGARFLHISTDCVFSGRQGNYSETDLPDAEDIYGRSKLLGEVNYPHCLTLRTSIIGHEIGAGLGLMEWFLAQKYKVQGYIHHIYSGFSTVELASIIARYILTHPHLSGVYHLSSEPISKYELLQLLAKEYRKEIEIEPDHETACDRSLNSSDLRRQVGYTPPSWPAMIASMHQDFIRTKYRS